MASPCIYSFDGKKWMSYDEFRTHLLDNFDKYVSEGNIDITKLTGKARPLGEVKKTITTHRAYEGAFREGVKKELEKSGLTREIQNLQEAKKSAKVFVEKVGEEVALDAVRNNDVQDAEGAYVWNEIIESVDRKLSTEKDPQKIKELESLQAQLIDEFGRKALSGGRFSAALSDIYEKSDLGYNVEKKINEYKDQNNGEIPEEVEKKFRDLDTELKEVKKKLAEAEKKAEEAEKNAVIEGIKESIARDKKQGRKRGKDLMAEGLDELGAAMGWTKMAMGDVKPNMVKALVKIGEGAMDEVGVTIENVWEKIKEKIKEKYGQDLPDSMKEQVVKNLSKKPQQESGKIMVPQNLIKALVEKGIDNIEDLTKAVKKAIKEDYPDATEREVRDAITNYGKTSRLNAGEIETRIRKMKRVGRILSALEDVANKKRPLKSGIQRDKLDASERALNKELREAMKDLPVDEQLREEQLKTATDATKQRIINQIEDLEREIQTKEKVKRSEKMVKDDAELIELKKKRDELKTEHDKIFKDEEFEKKQKLERIKKSTQRRIEDLERRIKEGDFSKKKVVPLIEDTELIKLKAEKIRIKEEYDKEMYKAKILNRTKGEKIKDAIWDAWGLTRALRATGEMSFVGIQGLVQTIAHPMYAAEAFKNSIKFLTSEKKAEEWLRKLKSQDFYPELKQSKLAITEPKAEMTAREELFVSDWANMIWNTMGTPLKLKSAEAYNKWKLASPMKGLERSAVGYLDTLRVLRYLDGKKMLEEKGIKFEDNKEAYKQMADVINTFTGRGSIGVFEQIAPTLTKIFFSPRNWASVLKTASPYAIYHFGKMRAGAKWYEASTAQKMAIADMSKFVGLTTSMVALAATYLNNDDDPDTKVELDPTSSDFGKIKIGRMRIDPWGGRIQQIVLTARLIADSVKKESGEKFPLGTPYKTPTRIGLLAEMGTNKLAPSASMLNKYLNTRMVKGERVTQYGEPYSFSEEITSNLYPIYWDTVKELTQDDVTALDGLLIFYSFFGGGVNIYDKKEKKNKSPFAPK